MSVNLLTPSNAQTLDPTQVYTTGNIVQQTPQGGPTPWVNGVYQNNLDCWAWGLFGYCGPNPTVRPGNNINFSFGMTDLHQVQAVANALPNSGSGLIVKGYNFGFTAKNGNGWDDGRVDTLSAYVNFYNPQGTTVFNKNYDLNYKFNWTTFNFSETFNAPFASKDLGNVRYGFVGKDNNFWAGPYGPEITNVSFNLKYSVDPCSVDVLSSPSCPGYLAALAKLTPATPTASATYETPTTVASTPVVTTTSSVSAPATATTEVATPTPVATSTSTNSSSTTGAGTPISTVASVSATPSATNPQPKVGEVQTSSAPASTQKSTVSMSQILSIVAGEQSRISNVEKSVVQEAVQQAISAGASATAQAESIAATAQAQSIATSNAQQQTQNQTQTANNNVQQRTQSQGFSVSVQRENSPTTLATLNSMRETSVNSATVTNQTRDTSSTGTFVPNNQIKNTQTNVSTIPTITMPKIEMTDSSQATIATTNTQPQQQTNYSLFVNQSNRQQEYVPPVVAYQPQQQNVFQNRQTAPSSFTEVQIRNEGIKFGDRNNIIEMSAQKPIIEDTSSRQVLGPSVKANVKDNDAAGGVTLASIARQPIGFESYFGVLADARFYVPKEIYQNQKTVDNARVLRGLMSGSDRLHQEMVDQQYK